MIKEFFDHWLDGEVDFTESISDGAKVRDASREELKAIAKDQRLEIDSRKSTKKAVAAQQKWFRGVYVIVAVTCCLVLIGTLLYAIAKLPEYGLENPRTVAVVKRYVEDGVEETGAVNIVSGIILDYRAFDTLGESHVLFTALTCVMILLRVDKGQIRAKKDEYYLIETEPLYDLSHDRIIRCVCMIIFPCLMVFGIYVLLNGQVSAGGGFSGGSILGAAMMIFATSFGLHRVDKVFTRKLSMWVSFTALAFYSFAKGYVFFTGANGLDNHIPKGTPGAILSGGLILPLDIAVGMVVTCTMFGFYSLFRRGNIGGVSEFSGK